VANMRSGPGCCVRILVLVSVMEVAVMADWTPPENPDPRKIRDEAGADTRAGRYTDALAKLTWFHENALTTPGGESLGPVRLSFGLKDWYDLAQKYPPALVKLTSYRDSAMQRVREGKDAFDSFQEAKGINEVLEEEKRTHELFLWLHANRMEVAKQVYALAEPLLVKAKLYKLCGSYLDRPEKA